MVCGLQLCLHILKLNNMKTLIETDHALYRKWDRGIDKMVLSKIYPFIAESRNDKKQVVLVMPTFFREQGIVGFDNLCLILVVKGKYLITCYSRKVSECFFCQKVFSDPQIIC
jgi:organic radical activating enzyme